MPTINEALLKTHSERATTLDSYKTVMTEDGNSETKAVVIVISQKGLLDS